ncbi:ABC transporter permease [Streptomyces sp. LBUM 1479]|nr:ABC transporter permease [Streptomyces sp. LBUM 1486]MBP5929643.1 ABC transporter permease [Streptomyces sp. LBUM 1479]
MPIGRAVAAVLTLALAGAVWQRYETKPGAGEAVNGAMALCLFLLVSAWLLAPLLVRPLVVPGALPGRLLSRYTGQLAAVTSAHAVRRVAAMSGPVLIAVGLGAALLCSGSASEAVIRSRTTAEASATAVPPGTPVAALSRTTASHPTLSPAGLPPTALPLTEVARTGPWSTGVSAEAAAAASAGPGADGAGVGAMREQQRRNEVGTRVLMAPLLVFSAVGILNTLLLATRQRRGEFAVLRLTGATGAQILRMLFWESVVVVVGGVVTAGAVLGVYLSVLARRLAPYGVDLASLVPAGSLLQVIVCCAALGLLGVLVPGALALRVRAVQATRGRD